MFDKFKDTFTSKALTCTNCGRKVKVGEHFTVKITMPTEKSMLVGRLDNVLAKTADSILCEQC